MDKAPNTERKSPHAAPQQGVKKICDPKTTRSGQTALEATSFLRGLFEEFQAQQVRYASMTESLLSLEARIELAEKTLCLTRDHLAMSIEKTDSAIPKDWTNILRSVRFVGMRLADACMTLLKEHEKMTPKEIFSALNSGMFRFRTNSPLREIHAALLRQNSAKKIGNAWAWTGAREQIPMRFRVLKRESIRPTPPLTDPALQGGEGEKPKD
jgi:hypothetical protein